MIFRQKTSYYTLYIYVCVHARGNPHLTAHNIIREAGRKRVVFHAVHCNPPRSAVQPVLQCTASRPAVQCIRRAYLVQFQTQVLATVPARTCNRSCTYLQPLLHVRASAPARTCVRHGKYVRPSGITFATAKYNVCNRGCKRYKPLPQTFAGKPLWRDAVEYAACTSPRHIGELATDGLSFPHVRGKRGKLLTEK